MAKCVGKVLCATVRGKDVSEEMKLRDMRKCMSVLYERHYHALSMSLLEVS